MLGVLAIATASFAQAAAQPSPSTIDLPDHRTLYSIDPLRSTITAEWICRIDEQPSRVVLTVTDVGVDVRNSTYKSELTDLAPGSGKLAPDLKAQVAAAIGELTTVPDVRGKCLGKSPVLIIEGFAGQGTGSVGRAFEFKLK